MILSELFIFYNYFDLGIEPKTKFHSCQRKFWRIFKNLFQIRKSLLYDRFRDRIYSNNFIESDRAFNFEIYICLI